MQKTITELLRPIIVERMMAMSGPTAEFLMPAVEKGLGVLEKAHPIGLRLTERGVDAAYGPLMQGGRVAVIVATDTTAVFMSYNNIPAPSDDEELINTPAAVKWALIATLVDKENPKDAETAIHVLMTRLSENGGLAAVEAQCKILEDKDFVPCLFGICRADGVHAAGTAFVLPTYPSIESQT